MRYTAEKVYNDGSFNLYTEREKKQVQRRDPQKTLLFHGWGVVSEDGTIGAVYDRKNVAVREAQHKNQQENSNA